MDTADKGAGFETDFSLKRGRIFINLCKYGDTNDIKASDTFLRHVVRKGCVAVDGMSLTVADVIPGGFRIWIIPHTLEVTNLSNRQAGDRVNLESDLLAKYAEKLLGKA